MLDWIDVFPEKNSLGSSTVAIRVKNQNLTPARKIESNGPEIRVVLQKPSSQSSL